MAVNKVAATLHFVRRAPVRSPREGESGASWTPNTDAYITGAGLVIKVELAGMRREDLELVVEQNQLRIAGVRHDCCREPECRFVVMEINYGQFESVIDLPPGYDASAARATYQNGFLRIDVPLRAPAASQPFSVPIATDDI